MQTMQTLSCDICQKTIECQTMSDGAKTHYLGPYCENNLCDNTSFDNRIFTAAYGSKHDRTVFRLTHKSDIGKIKRICDFCTDTALQQRRLVITEEEYISIDTESQYLDTNAIKRRIVSLQKLIAQLETIVKRDEENYNFEKDPTC